MSKLHDLIDAIADGKSVDIQQHFESIMTDKMVNAIEQRKYEVAQTLFSESVDESVLLDDISELTEEEAAAFIDSLDEAELEKLDEISSETLRSYIDKRNTQTNVDRAKIQRVVSHPEMKKLKAEFVATPSSDRKSREKLYKKITDLELKLEPDWNSLIFKPNHTHKAHARLNDRRLTKESLDQMSGEEIDSLIEDFDQLDELSKATLKSYVKKAGTNLSDKTRAGWIKIHAAHSGELGYNSDDHARVLKKQAEKDYEKGTKRLTGINKAVSRLTKESLDQMSESELNDLLDTLSEEELNELSKGTLGRYIKKAAQDTELRANTARVNSVDSTIAKVHNDHQNATALSDRVNKATIKNWDRRKNINKAVDRLTKESLDQMSGEEIDSLIEDFDQLDEISKATLGSYLKKASHDVAAKGAATRQFAIDAANAKKNNRFREGSDLSDKADKTFNKSWNRRKNMAKATDRLYKEYEPSNHV